LVLYDLDAHATDVGMFFAAADLLMLGDAAVVVLVLLAENSWPSDGDQQDALRRRGNCFSLLWLQLVPRANTFNWVFQSPWPAGRILLA
jgi:hypothetical protein